MTLGTIATLGLAAGAFHVANAIGLAGRWLSTCYSWPMAGDQDDADNDRELALWTVEWRTQILVVNMLRVVAGAGDPFKLAQQAFELGQALQDLPAGVRVFDANEAVQKALSHGLKEPESGDEFRHAIRGIEQDALRVVAARLAGQQVQVTRRQNDFFHSIGYLDRVRKANREEHERKAAERQPVAPIARKARKPMVAKAPSPRPKPAPATPAAKPEEEIDPSEWKTTADYMRLRQVQLKRLREGQS